MNLVIFFERLILKLFKVKASLVKEGLSKTQYTHIVSFND